MEQDVTSLFRHYDACPYVPAFWSSLGLWGHLRPALPASAATLMALISVKCTPKQNAALVDLKHKIGLLIYFIIDSSFLFFPFLSIIYLHNYLIIYCHINLYISSTGNVSLCDLVAEKNCNFMLDSPAEQIPFLNLHNSSNEKVLELLSIGGSLITGLGLIIGKKKN